MCTLFGWVFRIYLLLDYVSQFWSSCSHKMTENGGFWLISEKVPLCGKMITQSISNLVFTLVQGVFTNRPHKPNIAPQVAISVFPFPLISTSGGGRAFSDALLTILLLCTTLKIKEYCWNLNICILFKVLSFYWRLFSLWQHVVCPHVDIWMLVLVYLSVAMSYYPIDPWLQLFPITMVQSSSHRRLTHWGRGKMDAISQTTFSCAFSSMKIAVFLLNFQWNMFARVQLTIIQHWLR